MAFVPLNRGAGRLFEDNLNRMLKELYAGMDITQAENVVFSTYGDRVSVEEKAKNLNKFGRNDNIDTGQRCSVVQWPGATQYNETFVWTNAIDRVVSTSTSDTAKVVTIEGHTVNVSTGDFTFVVQNATLTGQTPVTLTTPLARCSRLYIAASGTFNSPYAVLAGNVSVYNSATGTPTAGVVAPDTAVKMYVPAGQFQSRKAQTTISSVDYFFIERLNVSIRSGSPTSKVEFQIERRDAANGGAWRPFGAEVSLETGAQTFAAVVFQPLLIVPKNHDVRVIAQTNANNTSATAEMQGVLAKVTG